MDFNKRIEAARKAAEMERQKKLKAQAELDTDVDDLLDGIDLDEIVEDEEFFHGRFINLRQVDRYTKLSTAAKWLYANSDYIQDILIGQITPLESSAHVTLAFRRMSYVDAIPQRVLALMSVLADTVAITCLDDGPIRMSFCVSNVWEE